MDTISTKPLFVAEISSNHHQNLDRCFDFIEIASQIGCDAVKFQLFRLEKLYAPEILEKSEDHRRRKNWELPLDFIPHIARKCKEKNVLFGCTPFYIDAVHELLPYVDFYKVASYEILWKDLLIACAHTNKPLVISTGMATLSEIDEAVTTILYCGCKDLSILHCVSGYPTPVIECNLAAIETLRREFSSHPSKLKTQNSKPSIKFGWSDHSVNPGVIYRAVHRWGAELIEFHLDLDGTGDEFKIGHCWLPDQIKAVIDFVRSGVLADGTGKKFPSESELGDREWRADPSDGLRPLLITRTKWKESE